MKPYIDVCDDIKAEAMIMNEIRSTILPLYGD